MDAESVKGDTVLGEAEKYAQRVQRMSTSNE